MGIDWDNFFAKVNVLPDIVYKGIVTHNRTLFARDLAHIVQKEEWDELDCERVPYLLEMLTDLTPALY